MVKAIQEKKKRDYKKDASWIALSLIVGGFLTKDAILVVVALIAYLILA